MSKTLEMIFGNAIGNRVTVRVPEAKEDLTGTQIGDAMDLIISKNIFSSTGGDLTSKVEARIVTRDVTAVTLS